MITFFDAETTGLVDFKKPVAHECQPHLVQLGALLCDDGGRIYGQLDLIIYPWYGAIPAEAAAVHGIDTATASHGVDFGLAITLFRQFVNESNIVVGHNVNFDKAVIECSCKQNTVLPPWSTHQRFIDTMLECTPICKLPAKWGNGYKWPKLTEAYRYFFNEDFEGAHSALADCLATRRIYLRLKELGHI